MEKGKKSKEKRKKGRQKEDVKEQVSPLPANVPDENTNEFGGIPFRNLKKNLGCG